VIRPRDLDWGAGALAPAVSRPGGPSVADQHALLHHVNALPFFLDAQGYHSATLMGMTPSVLMLTGGCLALLYTRIQRAVGYAGVFAFGYAAMATRFLLLVLSRAMFLTFAGAASIGAGYALVSPPSLP